MVAGLGLSSASCLQAKPTAASSVNRYALLDKAANRPVLERELFSDPVIIEGCELLQYGHNYMVRVRSKDGSEGYCVFTIRKSPFTMPIIIVADRLRKVWKE
jgi:hypothetical protein